jgi:large subunit ribosomal protein L29
MPAKDLREKSKEELIEHRASLQKEIEGSMEDILKGKEKNVKKIRELRKDIARVLTILKEKEQENNE